MLQGKTSVIEVEIEVEIEIETQNDGFQAGVEMCGDLARGVGGLGTY